MPRLSGIFAVVVAAGAGALLPASSSHAQQDGAHRVEPLTIEAPWARASAGAAKAGAAYLRIVNAGARDDRLVGVSSPVAGRVELHTHTMANGVMRMRKIDGVPVPAKRSVELKPGGHHVMLMGLVGPLKQGSTFPLTLVFESSRTITVPVPVRPVTARGPRTRHRDQR